MKTYNIPLYSNEYISAQKQYPQRRPICSGTRRPGSRGCGRSSRRSGRQHSSADRIHRLRLRSSADHRSGGDQRHFSGSNHRVIYHSNKVTWSSPPAIVYIHLLSPQLDGFFHRSSSEGPSAHQKIKIIFLRPSSKKVVFGEDTKKPFLCQQSSH